MGWRFISTRNVPDNKLWWWWTFFMVEVFLIIAIWIGHTQRLFAVQRVRVTMDQIVAVRSGLSTLCYVTAARCRPERLSAPIPTQRMFIDGFILGMLAMRPEMSTFCLRQHVNLAVPRVL